MSKVGTISKVSNHFYKGGLNVVITSDIWNRDTEYPKQFLPHVGYDYRAAVGTELVACFDGIVVNVVSGLGSTYGRQVFLYNETLNVTAHFAHLQSVSVKNGQTVKKGATVGLSGRSGTQENSYDAHLHFGLAKGKITNAGNKGSRLGELWLDVEEFNFAAKKEKQVLVLPSSLGSAVSVFDYKKGTKVGTINPKKFNGLEYDIVEITGNGDRVIVTETFGKVRIPPTVGNIKGQAVVTTPKPASNVGKNWTNSKAPLTLRKKDGTAYPAPSTAKRTYKILEETGDLIKIEHANFSPKQVWVKKSDGVIQ